MSEIPFREPGRRTPAEGVHISLDGAPTHQAIGKFQAGGFHHRMRDGESYAQKWQYVRENPVRAELVTRPDDWPYFGRVNEIRWSGD